MKQIFLIETSEVSCIYISQSLGRIRSASLSWEKHAAGHVRDEKRPDERGRVEAGPASCDAAVWNFALRPRPMVRFPLYF